MSGKNTDRQPARRTAALCSCRHHARTPSAYHRKAKRADAGSYLFGKKKLIWSTLPWPDNTDRYPAGAHFVDVRHNFPGGRRESFARWLTGLPAPSPSVKPPIRTIGFVTCQQVRSVCQSVPHSLHYSL